MSKKKKKKKNLKTYFFFSGHVADSEAVESLNERSGGHRQRRGEGENKGTAEDLAKVTAQRWQSTVTVK